MQILKSQITALVLFIGAMDGSAYSQDIKKEDLIKDVEFLKENIGNASVWFLVPKDLEWKTFSWRAILDDKLDATKKAIAKSTLSVNAGDFLLMDSDKSDLVASRQGVVIFKIENRVIGFRRRSNHISEKSLEIVGLTDFDPENKKIGFNLNTHYYGILLPMSYSEFVARSGFKSLKKGWYSADTCL